MNLNHLFTKVFMLSLITTTIYAQNDPEVSLKLRGNGKEPIAIIIENPDPISVDINAIIQSFVSDDFRVALVPKSYNYDLKTITSKNSPFVGEIQYILKLIVHNKSITEKLINISVEALRLSDGKLLTEDVAGPRTHIPILTRPIKKLLLSMMKTTTTLTDPKILSVKGNEFAFAKDSYKGLRRGDEISIRYADARNGLTESIAVVSRFSNDTVIAKDINNQVQDTDTVLKSSIKRNKFYLNVGVAIPTLGERQLIAQFMNNTWQSQLAWPVALQITGEYERYLPYQLVSTTSFGVSVDKNIGTFIMTGIGYRVLYKKWEFTPYLRLGVQYNALSLLTQQGTRGDLRGIALRFGVDLGINIAYRITSSMFLGLGIGAQYLPISMVTVLANSEKVKPQWKLNNQFQNTFSMTQLYPYLTMKIGWQF